MPKANSEADHDGWKGGSSGKLVKKHRKEIQNHGKRQRKGCQGKGNGRSPGKKTKRAATRYKKTTGVGSDTLAPRVLLGPSEEARQHIADFQHVVVVIGKWPAAASCIMFFFLPRTVDSDQPLEILATQIRWWEWVRAESMGYRKTQWNGEHQAKKQEEQSIWSGKRYEKCNRARRRTH